MNPHGARVEPIGLTERIESLDVLRGVAVLGILAMNIQSFAMPGAAYMNPTVWGGSEGLNGYVWLVGHLLADQKFMTIFSMLFGAGVIVMSMRCEATGRSSAGLHYRRMGWLLVIGLLHAHLLWYGDVLVTYALCGLLVWLFRKLRPSLLIVLGIVVVGVASALSLLFGFTMPFWGEEAITQIEAEAWQPTMEVLQRELDAYRGGWIEQFSHRTPSALMFETFLFLILLGWRAGGCMLIGMGLFKLGVFSAERSRGFYLTLVALAAFVALPVIGFGVYMHIAREWDVQWSMFLGMQFNYWASLLAALGWVGVVMLACRAPVLRAVTRMLAAVGRMALTNYLLETIICTTIFYGHGFGRFGHFERTEQFLTVLGVWAFLLAFSPLWLRYFRFGPAEWLWRSLTYMKLQPMLRRQ